MRFSDIKIESTVKLLHLIWRFIIPVFCIVWAIRKKDGIEKNSVEVNLCLHTQKKILDLLRSML